MKLVVGLGNPGKKYDRTRHNVGFDVVDVLARRHGIDVSGARFHGWFGSGLCHGERALLLKPTTFMNRSGRAVVAAGRFLKLKASDLLVVVDDVNLPLGRLRMRKSGSSGGHNGLEDIIYRLGGEDWCRLRVGIGEHPGRREVAVLSRFGPDEEPAIRSACERAADAIECWIREGPDLAMTRYNADV